MLIKYFMKRKNNTLAVLCTVLALLLVGCGGSTTTTPSSSPTATSSSTTASATLKHVPKGTADLNWDPSSHNLTVKISLTGLAPGPKSTHPAHIHTGSCSNQGPVIYPLKNLGADAHGNATMTTTISNVTKGIPASGWYVNVHNGPTLTPAEQFLPIVCSDVSNPNAS